MHPSNFRNIKRYRRSLFCENFIIAYSLECLLKYIFLVPGYGMSLIVILFEIKSPHSCFAGILNRFQNQVFLSMAASELWMNLQGTAIKIFSRKRRWLPNKLHIASETRTNFYNGRKFYHM